MRPMTSGEFEVLRARLVREYAAAHVRAGIRSEDEAEQRAAEQTDELLPQGVDTPGMMLLVAESPDGEPIGHVWVGLERASRLPECLDLLHRDRAKPAQQGLRPRPVARGRTRDPRRGVKVIGLNVFGPNTIARKLYESAGYEIASLQMHKVLLPPD